MLEVSEVFHSLQGEGPFTGKPAVFVRLSGCVEHCRPEFNRAFADAVARGTEARVRLLFPYARLDKRKIGDLGRRLGGDFTKTWTCYKGGAYHCGRCGACDERQYGLRHREGLDPTTYLKG